LRARFSRPQKRCEQPPPTAHRSVPAGTMSVLQCCIESACGRELAHMPREEIDEREQILQYAARLRGEAVFWRVSSPCCQSASDAYAATILDCGRNQCCRSSGSTTSAAKNATIESRLPPRIELGSVQACIGPSEKTAPVPAERNLSHVEQCKK